jgi:hypothetical protein
LAPVNDPSPPITTRFVIPWPTKFFAAFRRPARSLNSLQRADPITVPPWKWIHLKIKMCFPFENYYTVNISSSYSHSSLPRFQRSQCWSRIIIIIITIINETINKWTRNIFWEWCRKRENSEKPSYSASLSATNPNYSRESQTQVCMVGGLCTSHKMNTKLWKAHTTHTKLKLPLLRDQWSTGSQIKPLHIKKMLVWKLHVKSHIQEQKNTEKYFLNIDLKKICSWLCLLARFCVHNVEPSSSDIREVVIPTNVASASCHDGVIA